MDQNVNLKEDIHWVGVNDRRTHLFENLWPLEHGISYNSYLINDDRIALIDTVSQISTADYLDKLAELTGNERKIDYLIINHMEPDHSGSVKSVLERYPEIKIVGNGKTFKILEAYYGQTDNLLEVKNDDVLELGRHRLRFFMTPWVHWPETMMTYDQTDKILFSGDAFGTFGTLDGGIFDDEINFEFYRDEMRRYFSNIVGKYSNMVQKAIQKLEVNEIGMIAPTHGPVWRKEVHQVISLYNDWSLYRTEPGAVIIYGSMYGHTEKMADTVARALSERGIKNIRVYDVSKTHLSNLINEIWRCRGVILGSAAYNSGMLPTMENFTTSMEHIAPKDHYLGIFGSYSWTGGGVKALRKFAEHIEWELIAEPVEIKGTPGRKAWNACVNLANNMADKLLAKASFESNQESKWI